MKFPKALFVRVDRLANGGVDYYAYEYAVEAVDGDDPTEIATYRLVGSSTLRKTVVAAKRADKKRGPGGEPGPRRRR